MARARKVMLRLYVAGNAPNSNLARSNLEAALEASRLHNAVVTIIDVFEDPARAAIDNVVVTPMLIREGSVRRRLVGNLSDREALRAFLSDWR